MKKSIKIMLSMMLVCLSIFTFVACSNNSEKTYTCDAGLSITLNNGFIEKEIVGQTYYLQSTNIIFTATKELFTELDESGAFTDAKNKTLKNYANLIISLNRLSSQIKEDNDLVYFSYTKSVSGQSYYYFAVMQKGTDAFWLCQFACLSKNKDKYTPKFIDYAKTITVS